MDLQTQSQNSIHRIIGRGALVCIFAAALIYFVQFIVHCGEHIIGTDISCYYTGGEALNKGLSPYVNNVHLDPPLWDGFARYQYSRFIYPPIIAYFFKMLALLPYAQVKVLWMYVIVVCVGLSLWISLRLLKIKLTPELLLIMGIIVCSFYPLRISLEHGQVDALTMLLIVLAIGLMSKNERGSLPAGICLAIATFIKLHCFLIIPFLILRRKWKVLTGYIVASVVILAFSFGFNRALFLDYWFKQLPRISWVGSEYGPEEMQISPEDVQGYFFKPPGGILRIYKDGKWYQDHPPLQVIPNATIIRELGKSLPARGFYFTLAKIGLARQGKSILAFSLLGLFALGMGIWQNKVFRRIGKPTLLQEFVYWQIVLIIILLVGMRTWSPNTIWLLPIFIVLWQEYPKIKETRGLSIYFWLTLGALLFMASPDPWLILFYKKYGYEFVYYKYIIAEPILLLALLGMLTQMIQRDAVRLNHPR